ncbi:M20/M25/M40 family metallo-hydrolase [Herbiconiux daphne]|uniref:M20/M25/M40 family metallo-hydrolase n=1 Tax=Herbiconiux daphne TaxID=2970914 RepID=A0ABT2H3H5_9MICO|nr:M20/M25/M40 family metallo-hydrolase [Herbiconiux daphne]MCS5734491.1 M20/M25/M40 family metallo-hydrolase [Herbiconiux daphne]
MDDLDLHGSEPLLTDLRTLVEIESPSSDRAALDRSADAVAALGTRLLGVAPTRRTVDGVPLLEWRFGDRERLLLLGHHDTVWPLGSWPDLWSFDGEVVRGPGAFDMKAGVVLMLHAVAGLAERDGIVIVVTGDEETGSATSRPTIETLARATGVVLVTEAAAPGGALKTERSGVAHYVVEARGRAAHAGLEPEKGINATVELAHQVLALQQLGAWHPDATVTPTLLTSGDSANTVPALARLHVDVRARTTAAFDAVDSAVSALHAVLPGTGLTVTRRFASPPLEASSSAALFALATAVAAESGLAPVSSAAVGGASDGNIAAGTGAAVLDGLGAVGGGAHARDEHVLASELEPRMLLLRRLAQAVLDGRLATGAAR